MSKPRTNAVSDAFNTATADKIAAVKGTPAEVMLRTMLADANGTSARTQALARAARARAEATRKAEVESMRQLFVSRPCFIMGEELDWAVVGRDEEGFGVLAWCYDEEDARYGLKVLTESGMYTDLSYRHEGNFAA